MDINENIITNNFAHGPGGENWEVETLKAYDPEIGRENYIFGIDGYMKSGINGQQIDRFYVVGKTSDRAQNITELVLASSNTKTSQAVIDNMAINGEFEIMYRHHQETDSWTVVAKHEGEISTKIDPSRNYAIAQALVDVVNQAYQARSMP